MVWADFFEHLSSALFVTFIFGGWVITSVVSSIAKNWRKVHESEHQAALKQSMVDKGMSVEDIERVLRASSISTDEEAVKPAVPTVPAVALATQLMQHEVPAATLEQILDAFRGGDAATQQALAQSIEEMLDGGAESEQILAAVRALCRPAEPARVERRVFEDSPASFRG